jgi:hypothetical protein
MATYYVNSSTGSDSNTGLTGHPWATFGKAALNVSAGDTVIVDTIAGNASSYPTTGCDYTETTYYVPASGNTSSGPITWIGTGGMPTISVSGLLLADFTYHVFKNLYFVTTSNTNGPNWGLMGPSSGSDHTVAIWCNCVFNMNSKTQVCAIATDSNPGMFIGVYGCTFYGGASSTPTRNAGTYFIRYQGYSSDFFGNQFLYGADVAIYDAGTATGANYIGNQFVGCAGDAVYTAPANYNVSVTVNGNTFDSNLGHALNINVGDAVRITIVNNIFSNQTGSGKYAINYQTQTANYVAALTVADYNCYYNNTNDLTSNLGYGAHDLAATNPSYTTGLTPTNSALQAALP